MNFFPRNPSNKIFILLAGSVIWSVLWGFAGCGKLSGPSEELSLDADKAPYEVTLIRGINRPADKPHNETILMCDIDGDGVQECVEGTYQKILGYDSEDSSIKPRWEIHLDDDHYIDDESPRLGVSADLNADGIEEIFFVARAMDNSGWNFCVLDPAQKEIVLNAPLPMGEDRRRPDYWDGHYSVEGMLRDADGQGNPGVVLVRRVKYDATSRGVCVVEPSTGKVMWEYICAAQPAGNQAVVTDIDGDGTREIIFTTSAPGNWGDVMINGTLDIESYLIVLSNRGEELMRVVLGGERFISAVAVQDLEGDGIKELVTSTRNGNNSRTNEMVVWDWPTKSATARIRTSFNFEGVVICEGPQPKSSYIFAGTDDGSFHRYFYDGVSLRRDRMVIHEARKCRLVGAVDLLPSAGPEIVVQIVDSGTTAILDQELSTLAVYSDDLGLYNHDPTLWELADGSTALVMSNYRAYWVLALEEKPFDWAGKLLPVGASLLGFGILLSTFYFGMVTGRKRRKAASPPAADIVPGADFDTLFRLQQELEDAFHTVIAQAKGLERLVWLLDAYITDEGVTTDLELRIRQVTEDYQVEVKPRLFRLLHLAEQASFETGTVAEVNKALLSISSRIDELAETELNLDVVRTMRTDLHTDWKHIKDGFFQLRTTINTYFTTDPVRLLQGMLLVREGDFQREKIQTTMLGGSVQPGMMSCRIDNGDLRFVMDNLLDNAVRSMKDSSHRHLTVEVSRSGKEVGLRVTDTGRGIPKDQQDAIFNSRFSSRRGGGRGLYRSREILGRWGSEILMTDSRAGKGTTFVVQLLAAAEDSGQKTLEAGG